MHGTKREDQGRIRIQGRNLDRLIVNQFDPLQQVAGGVDTCIRTMVKYGHDTTFGIVGVDAGHPPNYRALGRWYDVELAGRTVAFMPVARLDPGDQRRRLPHALRLLRGFVRYRPAAQYRFVQSHKLDMGVALSYLQRRPVVQFLHIDGERNHGRGADSFWRFLPRLYGRLERRFLPSMADVVVFSGPGARRIRQFAPRARFSPTWFDPELFVMNGERERGVDGELLWVGRIEPQKDPLLAVAVLAAAPVSFRLTMVGQGTLTEDVRRAARAAGVQDRITLTGLLPRSEVARRMRRHRVLLLTSRYEGFARVVNEALACGLPVVTTAGGDPNQLIDDDRNGFRAPDRDADMLAGLCTRALALAAEDVAGSVVHLRAEDVIAELLSRP